MGFLVGVLLARGLGVGGYGSYGSAMAAATLGATLAAGGLQLHATREIAANRAHGHSETAARLIRWSYRTLMALVVPVSLIVALYVLLGQGASLDVAMAAMILTVLMSLLWLTGAVIRGSGAIILGQSIDFAIRPTIQFALLLCGMLLLGSLNPALALTLSAVAIVIALTAGTRVMLSLWRGNGPAGGPADKQERAVWRRASSTMGLTTAIRAAESYLPLILIAVLSSVHEAGLYRVAASAILIPYMAETIITVITPPLLAKPFEQKEMRRVVRIAAASCVAMTVAAVSGTLVFWVFGEKLLRFAFGADFGLAWLPMLILSIGAVISASGGLGTTLLHLARREAAVTRAFALSLFVSVLGVLFLAPQYGSMGVASAVLAGVVCRTIYLSQATWLAVGIDPTLFGVANNWRGLVHMEHKT